MLRTSVVLRRKHSNTYSKWLRPSIKKRWRTWTVGISSPANTDRGARAAQHVSYQFHHAFHVLPPKLSTEGLVLNVFLHFSALFVSIYPSAGGWDRGWIDGWIRINKIRLIGFNITWVGFFEVKASDSSRVQTSVFPRSGSRKIRGLHL